MEVEGWSERLEPGFDWGQEPEMVIALNDALVKLEEVDPVKAAIKLLPPSLAWTLRGDNELLQQFLREKRILARLQHPNIARLLDVSAGLGMRRTL